MRKPTPQQFLKAFPDTSKFFEQIKERAPCPPEELLPLVTYHHDRSFCENYMWSMLTNLDEFRLIELKNGMVTIPA